MQFHKIITAAILFSTAFVFTACHKGFTGGKPPRGEKTLRMPCYGPSFASDEKFFRASSLGESMDAVSSRKKALANAKSELASSINTTMKIVGDNFIESSEYDDKEVLLKKFIENSRTVVRQELTGINTACEQMTRTKEGKYKTYVCIEVPSEEMLASIHDKISRSDELKLDYKYERFKDEFEREMDKFDSERPF